MTTVVQIASGVTMGGTTASATFAALPAAGNSILVKVVASNGSASVVSVADNQTGNAFALDKAFQANPYTDTEIWRLPAALVTGTTYTVTVTVSTSTNVAVAIMEVNGITGVIDQYNSAFGSTTVTTYTLNNAAANSGASDIVIAMISAHSISGASGLTMPPSGYTSWDFNDNTAFVGFEGAAYKVVSATETDTVTWNWTNSTYPAVAIISYQGAVTPNTAFNPLALGTTPDDGTGDGSRIFGVKIKDSVHTLASALAGRPTNVGAFGVTSAAGSALQVTDASTNWTLNQFAGQKVTITTGTPPTVVAGVVTATSNLGASALIASNTAATLTLNSSTPLPFPTTAGCGYEISQIAATPETDGQATSIGSTAPNAATLVDATKTWTLNQFAGQQCKLLGGAYSGQVLPIVSNTVAGTLVLNANLSVGIAPGTPYMIGAPPINSHFSYTATATLASTQNNFAPTGFGASTKRVRAAAASGGSVVTGLSSAGIADGSQIFWRNTSSTATTTFNHLSTSSTAANRFSLPGGVSFAVPPLANIILVYDASESNGSATGAWTILS